jgi:hypothetical protein
MLEPVYDCAFSSFILVVLPQFGEICYCVIT